MAGKTYADAVCPDCCHCYTITIDPDDLPAIYSQRRNQEPVYAVVCWPCLTARAAPAFRAWAAQHEDY